MTYSKRLLRGALSTAALVALPFALNAESTTHRTDVQGSVHSGQVATARDTGAGNSAAEASPENEIPLELRVHGLANDGQSIERASREKVSSAEAETQGARAVESETGIIASDESVAAKLGADVKATEGTIETLRASQILGWDVVNTEGEKLGDVTDFAVRPESQDIPFLIVTSGGVLGIGGEEHFVPAGDLSLGSEDGTLEIDTNEEAWNTRAGLSDVEQDQLLRFFADVEGQVSMSEDDSQLGNVEDMLIRLDNTSVAYLLIRPDAPPLTQSWAGSGTLAAVPASMIMRVENGDNLVLNVAAEEIQELASAEETDLVDLVLTEEASIYRIDIGQLNETERRSATTGGETAMVD